MESKSANNSQQPKINPVERKTNEEIDTDENGNLFIGGEQNEDAKTKRDEDDFEGIED